MQTINVWNMRVNPLLYITHETAICYYLPILNFYRRWKKLYRSLIDKQKICYAFTKIQGEAILFWTQHFNRRCVRNTTIY